MPKDFIPLKNSVSLRFTGVPHHVEILKKKSKSYGKKVMNFASSYNFFKQHVPMIFLPAF
jgi:hypothetical protein